MKKNLYKAFAASAAVAMVLGMSACQDDDIVNDAPANKNEAKELDDKDYQEFIATPDPDDELTVSAPTSMMGLSPEMEALMSQRFVNRANGFNAEVIIADAQMLYSCPTEAKQAYEAGKVIIEVNVVGQEHVDFWKSLDVSTLLDKNCKASIVALHNGDNYKFEEVEEMVNSYLNPLVRWTNKGIALNQEAKADPSTKSATTRAGLGQSSAEMALSDYINDARFTQTITDVKTIHIQNYTICDIVVPFTDPDKVSRDATTVEAEVKITPVHVFQENNAEGVGGDYYFVSTNVTSHNRPLYGTYKKWHGWVCTYAHAFYCTKVNFDANLTGEGIGNNVKFFQTPTPTTTSTSTKYDEGFTTNLNFSGQGGFSQKAGWNVGGTVALGFTWTNNHSITVSDQSIEQWTESNGAKVHYSFNNNNFQEEDETDKAIPAIARNDQSCKASWCWHVTDAKDDADNDYQLRVNYQSHIGLEWRHATWTCEGSAKEAGAYGNDITFTVNHPNRMRRGVLNFTSNCGSSKIITDIKVYKFDATKGYDLLIKDFGTLGTDVTKTWTVPVGDYKVEYSVKDRDDFFTPADKYYIDQIDVKTGDYSNVNSAHGKKLE